METKIIYYVHGTTYDNASKRCSGWRQVELNDLGKEQAKDLGKNTKFTFDVLFSSDLIRSIDSANLAFPEVEKHQDKRLRECNYGDYDGEDKTLVVYEEHIDTPFPNGESLKDVEKRVREFLKDIYKKYPGKKEKVSRSTLLSIYHGKKPIKMIGEKQAIGKQDGNIFYMKKIYEIKQYKSVFVLFFLFP